MWSMNQMNQGFPDQGYPPQAYPPQAYPAPVYPEYPEGVPEVRSAAVGSDETVPPPASTLFQPPPPPIQQQQQQQQQLQQQFPIGEERGEAAGSDQRPPIQPPQPPPPTSTPLTLSQPEGRNVPGANDDDDDEDTESSSDSMEGDLDEEDNDDVSEPSTSHRQKYHNNHRGGDRGREHRDRDRDQNSRHRPPSHSPSRTSTPASDRSFAKRNRNDRDRDRNGADRQGAGRDHRRKESQRDRDRERDRDRDRDHNRSKYSRSSRGGADFERSYRDRDRDRDYSYRDRDESYRYYDDYNRSERSFRSRPSSRGGDRDRYDRDLDRSYYRGHYGPPSLPHYYAHSAYPPQGHYGYGPASMPGSAPAPDPATLEAFRKNWEYYCRNPAAMETLRLTKPQQHQTLLQYYQTYSHLLPTTTVSESERPASRSSLQSGKSKQAAGVNSEFKQEFHQLSPSHRPESREGKEMSTIYGEQYSLYQPTPDGSHAFEQTDNEVQKLTSSAYEKIPEVDPTRRLTPVKFPEAHVHALFTIGGHLLRIEAKRPQDGKSATIDVHSIQTLLRKKPMSKELKDYPGPLIPGQTHKGEVIKFCQRKIGKARKNRDIVDFESYILLWELMILLLRQKNAIDGSDIAELLLKDRDVHKPFRINNKANSNSNVNNKDSAAKREQLSGDDEGPDINGSDRDDEVDGEADPDQADDVDAVPSQTEVEEKFRDYMLYGKKKEGLEYAMRHGLWGHALFLASKMDERSYSSVMLRFANGLLVNDPLQTLYQMMSGRQPIAVKECADQNWGDWRPHLAMILSNAGDSKTAGLERKSILSLGDTLIERGFLYAGHFCYLVGNAEFGTVRSQTAKLVLIGSDHRSGDKNSLECFATNEAIQITEISEYVQKLANPDFSMKTMSYYKFQYALRLLDYGYTHTSFHYLEELAKGITKKPSEVGTDYDLEPADMARQILHLCERLKYLDPSYTTREGEMADMPDPEWLVQFRTVIDSGATSAAMSSTTASASEFPQSGYDAEGRLYMYDAASNSYYYPDQNQANADDQNRDQPEVEDEQQQQQHSDSPVRRASVSSNRSHHSPVRTLASAIDRKLSIAEEPHQQQQLPDQEQQEQPQVPQEGYDQEGRLYKYDAATNSYYYPDQNNATEADDKTDHQVKDTKEQIQPAAAPPPMTFNPSSMPPMNTNSMPPPMMPPTQAVKPPTGASLPPTANNNNNYFADVGKKAPPPAMSNNKLNNNNNNLNVNNKEKADKGMKKAAKAADAKDAKEGGSGLFGKLLGKLGVVPKNQVHLPDDKDKAIVWDDEKKRWVDKSAGSDDDSNGGAAAPPSDMELSRSNSTANFEGQGQGGPPGPGMGAPPGMPPPMAMGNKFAGGLGKRRGLAGRVDVFKSSQSSPALSSAAAAGPTPMMPPPIENMLAPMPGGVPPAPEPEQQQPPASEAAPPVQDQQQEGAGGAPVFFNPTNYQVPAPGADPTMPNPATAPEPQQEPQQQQQQQQQQQLHPDSADQEQPQVPQEGYDQDGRLYKYDAATNSYYYPDQNSAGTENNVTNDPNVQPDLQHQPPPTSYDQSGMPPSSMPPEQQQQQQQPGMFYPQAYQGQGGPGSNPMMPPPMESMMTPGPTPPEAQQQPAQDHTQQQQHHQQSNGGAPMFFNPTNFQAPAPTTRSFRY